MKSDGLLTPKIVKPLLTLVCEGQSHLVRQGGLAGDSPSLSSFTCQVYDAFTDGDYTSNPAWTVESGTWSAASEALVPVPQSGARAIATANTYGNADIWYAFKRTGTGGGLDNSMVQLRYVDANNWLGVRFMWNMLIVVEKVNGVEQDLAYTDATFDGQDVWYDIYIQLDGSSVVLFACERGDTVQRLLETTTSLGASTSVLRVRVSGVMPFEFDDFRVCSRSIHAGQSMVFTYGPANQLATMTTSGVTSSYTYDPWGRLASRSATISGQSYTATYTYRWGDKLQRIDSNFPGETPVVLYNYDGLGKRRLKAVGNDTTYWRWDAGYSVLAQYGDSSPDWTISGFDRFFVPFGHTALAEADLDASGVPANAAYTYLAHDHLGTSYYGFNQSKTVVSQNVHLPFGQRSYASGNSPYHEFTGKPWDAELQMYYYPYRYYSPYMNRWTGADPAGLVDGPNVYGYVLNSPLLNIDKYGLAWSTSDFVTWYRRGRCLPVDLSSIGLLDAFRNTASVGNAVGNFIKYLANESRIVASVICKMGNSSTSFSRSSRTVTNVGRHNPSNPLYSIGHSTFFRRANCSVSADCCKRTYSYSCNMHFKIRDRFEDPLGINVEFGCPYSINADWNQMTFGKGSI